jgi:hypothetical protein
VKRGAVCCGAASTYGLEGLSGCSETFGYDSLNRLTQAVVYDHANPAAGSALVTTTTA